MNSLPPRQRLAWVVRSLTQHLPQQLEGLLEHPRFSEGAAALERLGTSSHLDEAVGALKLEDASWLADSLLELWGKVAPPRLEPEVAIDAPDEVWLGPEPVRVSLGLVAHGLDEGYVATWEGPVVPGPPAATTTLIAQPPSPGQPCEVKVRAHVRASARGERRVLIAQARIRIRRPAVVVSDDHRKFVVRDQLEQPAVGMRLQIGASEYLTGAGGLVELPAPAPSGSPLRVQGISAGRVPDGKV